MCGDLPGRLRDPSGIVERSQGHRVWRIEVCMSHLSESSPRFDSKSHHAIPDWGNFAPARDSYLLVDSAGPALRNRLRVILGIYAWN